MFEASFGAVLSGEHPAEARKPARAVQITTLTMTMWQIIHAFYGGESLKSVYVLNNMTICHPHLHIAGEETLREEDCSDFGEAERDVDSYLVAKLELRDG